MNISESDKRTYDRHEVELILRAAVQLDDPQSPAPIIGRDGLTLAEIQDAGSQAGIDPKAIAAATLSVALESAHANDHRLHHVHLIAGELQGDALDQLADHIRGAMPCGRVRRSDGALDVEMSKGSGALGRLIVSVRSKRGATSISIWSDAPHLSVGDIVASAAVGIPLALFPVVASSGGQWPALGGIAALAALGSAVGAGAALGWQRIATARWRKHLTALLTPMVARATALASIEPTPSHDE